jgi:broad specificity phosphatase PhoE
MKIYFIRHGHADHNAAFDEQQTTDVYSSHAYRHSALTTKGIGQIEAVKLPQKPQRVYCSPLKRCIQTARIIFGNDELLYLHDGLLETQGPFPCNWREFYETFAQSKDAVNIYHLDDTYVPSQVQEEMEDVKRRAELCLETIKKETVHLDSIAIVTHNDWLESIFGRKFSNGEVYCLENSSDIAVSNSVHFG